MSIRATTRLISAGETTIKIMKYLTQLTENDTVLLWNIKKLNLFPEMAIPMVYIPFEKCNNKLVRLCMVHSYYIV